MSHTSETALILAQQAEIARLRATQCELCRELPTFRDAAIFLGDLKLTRYGIFKTGCVRYKPLGNSFGPWPTLWIDHGMYHYISLGPGALNLREQKHKTITLLLDIMDYDLKRRFPYSADKPFVCHDICAHAEPVWLALFQEIHDHFNSPSAQ